MGREKKSPASVMRNLYKRMTRKKARAREKKQTAGKEDTPKHVAIEQMKNLTQEVREHREAVASMKKIRDSGRGHETVGGNGSQAGLLRKGKTTIQTSFLK